MDDLDDLLARREALQHLRVDRALLDTRDEVLRNGEVYVGLEQRHTDLAQRLVEVFLGEPALVTEPSENALEAV